MAGVADDVIDSVVEIRGLSQAFNRAKASDGFLALRNVDFVARRGEFVSIVGPSGCGKSTLLSLISGLLEPTVGTVQVNGQRVRGVRPDVGFIFQKDALLPWRTSLDNVALALKYRGVAKGEGRRRAGDWLRRVGLGGFEEYYPHQLSGGMRKRVAIAATLVYEPPVLLMDEPFSSLDVQTRNLMENDLLELWDGSGQTVVLVTHDLEEAVGVSDRVVVISAGPGHVVGDYSIELPRPRDLLEVKFDETFVDVHKKIWEDLRLEVLKAKRMGNPTSPAANGVTETDA